MLLNSLISRTVGNNTRYLINYHLSFLLFLKILDFRFVRRLAESHMNDVLSRSLQVYQMYAFPIC